MPFKVVVKPNQLRQNRSKKRSDKINFGLFYRFFKVITKNEMLFQWPLKKRDFFILNFDLGVINYRPYDVLTVFLSSKIKFKTKTSVVIQ